VVGDAARQTNPLTAGGIMNALEAADCLTGALLNTDKDRVDSALRHYTARWNRRHRTEQKTYTLFQRTLVSASDREIIELIASADKAFPKKIDRSIPFSPPLSALGKLGVKLAPKLIKHTSVLWA
jgi:flavin-dependent dehydrogenase